MRRVILERNPWSGRPEYIRRDLAGDVCMWLGGIDEFKGTRREMADRLRNPRRLWKLRAEPTLKKRLDSLEYWIQEPTAKDSELIWHAVQITALLLRNRRKRKTKP